MFLYTVDAITYNKQEYQHHHDNGFSQQQVLMAQQKLVVHLEMKVEREFFRHVIHLVTNLTKG